MDSKLVNAKAEEFVGRVVRLTPALMNQLGLEKRNSHLRVDEFFISCIPFDLSLKTASLLSVLSEAEIEFFAKLSSRPHKLSMTFSLPYTSKPASFFVICDIRSLHKPSPTSPYCFIDIEFREVPLVLKEILVGYFMDADEAERFFKEASDAPVGHEQVLAIFESPRLSLLKEDRAVDRLKVCYLSPRRIRVFGEFEGAAPAIGEAVEFEPCEGDSSCMVRAVCRTITPLPEVEGFAFLDADLEFTPRLFDKMRRAVKIAGAHQAP
jgi:hypothetical protein